MNKLIDWISSEKEECFNKLNAPQISHSDKFEYIIKSEIFDNIMDFIRTNSPSLQKHLNINTCSEYTSPLINQVDALQKRLDVLERDFYKKLECHHCLIKSRVDIDQWWCVLCNNVIKMKILENDSINYQGQFL